MKENKLLQGPAEVLNLFGKYYVLSHLTIDTFFWLVLCGISDTALLEYNYYYKSVEVT